VLCCLRRTHVTSVNAVDVANQLEEDASDEVFLPAGDTLAGKWLILSTKRTEIGVISNAVSGSSPSGILV